MLECYDTSKGVRWLRARVCLTCRFRFRIFELLLLGPFWLTPQQFFVSAVELLDQFPFSVNSMKLIIFLLLCVIEVLFELVCLISKGLLTGLPFLHFWLSVIFYMSLSLHFLFSLDDLLESALLISCVKISRFHLKLFVSCLDIVHPIFEIFKFSIELVYLIIDLFHSVILFHAFLLSPLCDCRGLLEDILLFDAVKSNDHLFFARILIDHTLMLQHLLQFSLSHDIRRFLTVHTPLTLLLTLLPTLQSPHFRYLPQRCLRLLFFRKPILLFESILRPVHLEMIGKSKALLLRFIISLSIFFGIKKRVVVGDLTRLPIFLHSPSVLSRRLIVRVHNSRYFRHNRWQIRPSVGLFLRKDDPTAKGDLKRTNLRVYHIFVSIRINVLVLRYLKRYQIRRDHITNDLNLRHAVRHHLANWIIFALRLRNVSWYLASSWCVHQLCV